MTTLINFFEALAIFSAHDILPLDVTDITLYEQLKSKWNAMNGDEKCQCDWCDAEPLQYQEELQHTEGEEDPQKLLEEYNHLFAQKGDVFRSIEIVSSLSDQGYFLSWQKEEQRYELTQLSTLDIHPPHITPTELSERQEITIVQLSKHASISIDPHGYVIIRSGEIRTIYLSAREAYALLDALYQHRDLLDTAGQKDESEPAQKSELQQYAEKHLAESRKGILLGTGLLSWPPSERITGRYGLIALFEETEEPELTDFDYMHTESWIASSWQTDITSLAGKHGSLVVVLDGEEIELGKGIFFLEEIEETYYVGLIPDEAHELEWLSPTQLHKVDGHITNKPVELWFVEQ